MALADHYRGRLREPPQLQVPLDPGQAEQKPRSPRQQRPRGLPLDHLGLRDRPGLAPGLDRRSAGGQHVLEPVRALPERERYNDPLGRWHRRPYRCSVLTSRAASLVPDEAGEEVAAPGQPHHGRVAEALVEGTRGVGDGLYRLQAKERQDEHQQQRRERKYAPQNETPQRVASGESTLVACPDGVLPSHPFILPSALIHPSSWKGD